MDSMTEFCVTTGESKSHNFLHLTLQEYLAAVHISNMDPYQQVNHFKRYNNGRYYRVLSFLAGITKYKSIDLHAIYYLIDLSITPNVLNTVDSSIVITDIHINWLFEAQSSDLLLKLFGGKTVHYFEDENKAYLPLDYYSLGYCIVHSSSQWILSFFSLPFLIKREEEMRMLVEGASTKQEPTARVVGLAGSLNPDIFRAQGSYESVHFEVSADGLDIFFSGMKHILCLKELWLSLPTDCSSISWPDLSQLQELHLKCFSRPDVDLSQLRELHFGCNKTHSWNLDTLLSNLSLETLKITSERDMLLNLHPYWKIVFLFSA